jgi:hypothetical protein
MALQEERYGFGQGGTMWNTRRSIPVGLPVEGPVSLEENVDHRDPHEPARA